MPSTTAMHERDPEPVLAQRPAEAGAAVLDRQRTCPWLNRYHAGHPYQTGTVSQVRAALDEHAVAAGVPPVVEEPVDGRAGTADVGAERAEPQQLGGERRRREVVRRQRGEVARPADVPRAALERGAPRLAALGAPALVEAA